MLTLIKFCDAAKWPVRAWQAGSGKTRRLPVRAAGRQRARAHGVAWRRWPDHALECELRHDLQQTRNGDCRRQHGSDQAQRIERAVDRPADPRPAPRRSAAGTIQYPDWPWRCRRRRACAPSRHRQNFVHRFYCGWQVDCARLRHTLKRVTLELGGKSPAVLLDDADFRKAMPLIAAAAAINSGRCCAIALSSDSQQYY